MIASENCGNGMYQRDCSLGEKRRLEQWVDNLQVHVLEGIWSHGCGLQSAIWTWPGLKALEAKDRTGTGMSLA